MRTYGSGHIKKRSYTRKDGSVRTFFEAYIYDSEGRKVYGHGVSPKQALIAAKSNVVMPMAVEEPPEFDSERERIRTVYDFAIECVERDAIREQSAKRYKEVALHLSDPELDLKEPWQLPDRSRVLGQLRLDRVTYEDVEVFFSRFRRKNGVGSEGVLRTLLSRTFRRAIRRGWMARNFVSELDPVVRNVREREALSDEYMSAMISGTHSASMRTALLLLTLGLRADEVLGATRDEIENGYLRIRHQQVRVEHKSEEDSSRKSELALGPTKRLSSNRALKLPTVHLQAIAESLVFSKPTRIWTHDGQYQEREFIAPNQTGGCWSYNAFRAAYHKLRSGLDLPHSTPHDWRATAATNSIESQNDPKAVAKILGHSRVDQTLGIYTRTRKSVTDSITEQIGARVEKGLREHENRQAAANLPAAPNLLDEILSGSD